MSPRGLRCRLAHPVRPGRTMPLRLPSPHGLTVRPAFVVRCEVSRLTKHGVQYEAAWSMDAVAVVSIQYSRPCRRVRPGSESLSVRGGERRTNASPLAQGLKVQKLRPCQTMPLPAPERDVPMTQPAPAMPAHFRDLPSSSVRLLEQAVVILRAGTHAREGLERLLAQSFGLVDPAIHLAGEPLDPHPGRVVLPGGAESLRVTTSATPDAGAHAAAIVSLLLAIEPLLRDLERKADTRHVLQAMCRGIRVSSSA